ncbi:MAG: J domain-containing protein [Pyrinomonadaceae bacterium]
MPIHPAFPFLRMVNYYETLKVSPKASKAEIKSAYRRLARRLHPDKNNGSEQTAIAFAAIAEAYEVLGNPKQRSAFDMRLATAEKLNGNGDSLFASTNTHAQRWRQMIYEHRYNEIIDRMIAEERSESQALQKFLFPIVALCVSAMTVGIVRPNFFLSDYVGIFGRIMIVSFFIVGIIHIIGRVRAAFDKYTYDDDRLHDTILDETELPTRQYSRYALTAMLVGGIAICFAVGLGIGFSLEVKSFTTPYLFSPSLTLDMLLFPPIFVLIVAAMHELVLKAEGSSQLDVSRLNL